MKRELNTPQSCDPHAALAAYEILDTPQEAVYDDFTRLAAQICATPIALISLLDVDRQWFKSKVGTTMSETPLTYAFCTCTVLGDQLLEVPDLTQDPRFKDSPFVVGEPGLRFYAGVPLTTPEGARIGALCVADVETRILTDEQKDALATLARHVVNQLELRLAGIRQKKLHEELARKSAFKHALIESVATMIVCVTPEGKVTHYNRDAEELLGYKAEEVVGKRTPLLWHDSREIFARARVLSLHEEKPVTAGFGVFTARIHEGQSETREWTFVRKDGSRVPALLTVSVMQNTEGRRIGYLMSARDLTDLKKAEAQRERFFTLSLDLLGVATLDGYFVRINPAFADVLGYTQDELLEKPFINFVEPEDRPGTKARVEKLSQEQATLSFENRYRCKDGTIKWISWKMQSFPSEGLFFCTGRDVTESKKQTAAIKAGERQRAKLHESPDPLMTEKMGELERQKALIPLILENLPAGVMVCDAEGRLVLTNRVARGWLDFEGVPSPCRADMPLMRASRGEHVRDFELTFEGKANAVFHVLASSVPLLNEQGERVGAVCLLEDNTERKLADKNTQREQRLESIGALASGVAHDLSNILSPILLFTGVIKAKYPEDIKMVEAMESGANRGVDMVRQLLALTKGNENAGIPVRSRTVLEEMKKIVEATFPKNIDLRISCPSGLPPVLGDPKQLHQAMLNLCLNARDAMPCGGTLFLEAECAVVATTPAGAMMEAKPGRYVIWQVRDTGTGIAPDKLERIFEPFSTARSSALGSGFGLSTVLAIVKSHHGFIRVISKVGEGAAFMIYLPEIAAMRQEPATPAEDLPGKGETILVVDDERSVRDAMAAMLEALNYRVIKAANGTEALVKAESMGGELKAVLTDMRMPQMDGLEFTRALKVIHPKLPVLVMSGRLDRATAAKFKELGVTVFLDKPFSPDVLLKHIRASVGA